MKCCAMHSCTDLQKHNRETMWRLEEGIQPFYYWAAVSIFNYSEYSTIDSFYEICCGPHLFDLHQSSSLHWPWVSDSIFDEISTTRLCLKLVVLHWLNTSAVCRLEWNCLLKFCPRSFPACTLMEARLQCWWGHTTCYYFPISTFENAT